MADWWEKPFSIEVDGEPWAVLTDKVFLVAIRGPNKLPALKQSVPPDQEDKAIAQMLRMKPKDPKPTSKERLISILETDDYVSILGFPVDTERLLRVLNKLKGTDSVSLWDASGPLFAFKCLGLVSGEKWRAFVMGNKGKWPDLPVYSFEEDPKDVFDELAEASPPEKTS
jgi:hypothetical protein